MENKILKWLLIVILIILSINLPLTLIFYNNREILSLLSGIFFITFYSYGIILLTFLIYTIFKNKAEMEKIEINLLIGFISGNLILIFLFFFLANTSIFNVSESSLVFPIIGIVVVLFNALIIAIFVTFRTKNLKKKYLS